MKSSNRILSLIAGSTFIGIILSACVPGVDAPVEPETTLNVGCGAKDAVLECHGDDGSSSSENISLNITCDSTKTAITATTTTALTRDRASENCRLDNAAWKSKKLNGNDILEFKCAEDYGGDGTIFRHRLIFKTTTSAGETKVNGRLENENYYFPVYTEDLYVKDTFETDPTAQKGSSYCTFSYIR